MEIANHTILLRPRYYDICRHFHFKRLVSMSARIFQTDIIPPSHATIALFDLFNYRIGQLTIHWYLSHMRKINL